MSESMDRISDIPESLLHHIICFLEIKDGARTSVLSKRWNSIWTSIPTLRFHRPLSCSFLPPSSAETDKFMDFVDGTLHRHNSSNIQNFFLFWREHLNETRVHSWISTVIRGKVQELGLYLTQTRPLFIPLSLFTCESLMSLELGAQHNITLPKYISFPRLKRLKLYKFEFSDECWNDEIFSNSTALEELILDFCTFRMRNFTISIPTLKLLKIRCFEFVIDVGLQDCALKIDAPNLLTFVYSADVAKEYAIPSFLTLVEAVVRFKFEQKGAQISRLLRALAHVKRLTVNDSTLQAICSAYDPSNSLLTFHNVKMLNCLTY
ncbi:F-box/LRR-repeat protein At1g52650-like [Papaver somniferum]|nr:F-box/LRR-repeat protein At1g52650-like [Papaver somniferum]XP_026423971.1 F-box/LRR-repeat protein At1g52650-like [Papaver somniferum]